MVLLFLLCDGLAAKLADEVGRIGLEVRFLLGVAILGLGLIAMELVRLVDVFNGPSSHFGALALQTR